MNRPQSRYAVAKPLPQGENRQIHGLERDLCWGIHTDEDEDSDDEQSLPRFKRVESKMEPVKLVSGKQTAACYTEATLLSAMEHPGKFEKTNYYVKRLKAPAALNSCHPGGYH